MITTRFTRIGFTLLVSTCAACAGAATQAAPPASAASAPAKAASASPAPEAKDAASGASALEQGRALTASFYGHKTAELWPRLSPEVQSNFGSEDKLAAFRTQLEGELGAETRVIDETVTNAPPYRVYLRTAAFSKSEQPVIVQWALSADGKVAGFFVRPKPAVLEGSAAQGAKERGQALTLQFYKSQLDELWAHMSAEMQAALGSKEQFAAFRKQLDDKLGTETQVLDEKAAQADAYLVYVRTAAFSKSPTPVVLQWAFAADGKIAGFVIRPAR